METTDKYIIIDGRLIHKEVGLNLNDTNSNL